MNLFQKLLDIRKSVEYIQKTEKGNQGAMYVDPAVLLKKIRDKMNDLGILLFPKLLNSNLSIIDAPTSKNPNNKGFLFTSEASYTFIDSDNPDDKLFVEWFMTGSHLQDPAMAEGGALTYSERYFLLKFFQIPTAKDDPEYFKNKTKEPEPAKTIQIGEKNVAWLVGFCKRNNITDKDDKVDFQAHYGFDPYKTTEEEFNAIKSKILQDYNEE